MKIKKTLYSVGLFAALCLLPGFTYASWGTSTLADEIYAGYCNSIAVDVNDNIHVAYVGGTDYRLRYAKYNGSGWTFEDVDTSGIPSFKNPSIAVDVQGNPHISYYDSDAGSMDLKYATRTASGWGTQVVDSGGDVGKYSSLALDGRGYPHIAYYDVTNTNLKYAKWTGGGWTLQTVDSEDTTGDGEYCSLALDGPGNPHISYLKEAAAGVFTPKYAKWTPQSGWVKEDIETSNIGKNTSIAIDGNGIIHVSYNNGSSDIVYASSTSSGWSWKKVHENAVSNDISIAMDGSGIPHIIYHEPSTWFRLNYSSYPNWVAAVVDGDLTQSRDMGNSNSFAFDSAGRACIVYSSYNADASEYHLRFATSSFTFAAPMGGNSRGKVQSPTNFSGSVVSASQIDWSWSNNSSNAFGYRVYCSSAGGNFYLAADTVTLSGNSQTTWSQTGLAPNTSYQCYTAAVNAGGVVTSSSSLVWTLANPPADSGVVSVSSYSITLSWSDNGNPGYTRWGILRSTDNFVTSTVTLKSAGNNYTLTSITDTYQLSANTTYWYKVQSFNGQGIESSFDTIISSKTNSVSPIPGIPQNFSGTAQSVDTIRWMWDSVAAVSYKLFDGSGTQIGTTIDSGEVPYDEGGLSPNTAYSRYVVAYNDGGASTATATVSCYTLAGSPSNLTALSVTDHTLNLSWTAPAGGAAAYKITRTKSGESAVTVIDWSDLLSTTTYSDSSLASSASYQYVVQSYNADGVINSVATASVVTTQQDVTIPQQPVIEPSVSSVTPGDSIDISGYATDASTENFSQVIIIIYDQDNRPLATISSETPGSSPYFTNSLSVSTAGVISGVVSVALNFSEYFPMATGIKIGIQLQDDGGNLSPEPSPGILPEISVDVVVSAAQTKIYNNIINTPSASNPAIIRYEMPSAGSVSVKLYDLQGRLVKTIFEGQDSTNVKYWYGKNSGGNIVASGVYLLHVKAGGVEEVHKIVVVK